jgi:hypothetical protein
MSGRHVKDTSWWLFGAHLVMVLSFSVGMMWAFSEGIMWLGIVLSMGWLSSFALTAGDNVRIPLFDRVVTEGSRVLDRVRRMGENRKTG